MTCCSFAHSYDWAYTADYLRALQAVLVSADCAVAREQVSKTALTTSENILMCAPTGAGKTNVAMLAIMHTLGLYRNVETGTIDADKFKIIYVAPMKARERLTGDCQRSIIINLTLPMTLSCWESVVDPKGDRIIRVTNP